MQNIDYYMFYANQYNKSEEPIGNPRAGYLLAHFKRYTIKGDLDVCIMH